VRLTRRPLYRRGKSNCYSWNGVLCGPKRRSEQAVGEKFDFYGTAYEYFEFLMVADSISTSCTATNRTVTARNRTGRGRWVDK
jgi:hypothetical protein